MAGRTCILCQLIITTLISSVICIVKESQSYGVGKLAFCNPKYFSYCSVVSAPRVVDGVERIFTNHTFTNVVTVGNNFTVAGVFISQKGHRYQIEHKFCDYLKQYWIQSLLKSVAHVKLVCPLTPNTYHISNLELPPPNIPVPMVPGTYNVESEVYTTVSKERVIMIYYTIHITDKRNRKNKNKNVKV